MHPRSDITGQARVLLLGYAVSLTGGTLLAQSPIVHDGSIGIAGAVPDVGGTFLIEPANGVPVGPNLFHSFSKFSVPPGTTASFGSNPGTTTVLARVTGGASSLIDGTLKTTVDGTSLYLINPAGIIFGNGASLEAVGSFHAVAGDYLTLSDGGVFWADSTRAVSLSSAPVSSFGFLSSGSASPVVADATLRSGAGGSISLVGRKVEVTDATLRSGNHVFLGAMGSASGELVSLDTAPAFEPAKGTLTITDSSLQSGGTGTRMLMRAGDIRITSSDVNRRPGDAPLAADLVISASGDIMLESGTSIASISGTNRALRGIDVKSGGELSSDDSSIIAIADGGAGAADIRVRAESLRISGNGGDSFSGITSNTFSSGSGGQIDIDVAGTTRIDRAGVIGTFALGSGDAGQIDLRTGLLEVQGLMDNGPPFVDFITGVAGITQGVGQGGQIEVHSMDGIVLERGGLIDSSSIGPGAGGSVFVTAPSILIDRAGSEFFTGIGSDASANGGAGDVEVVTGSLTLLNGGLVSTSAESSGDAGNIVVVADRIFAKGRGRSSVFALTENSGITAASLDGGADAGLGGSIDITAGELVLSDQAEVLARSSGGADGGRISISADQLSLWRRAAVSSEALGTANAGEIRATGGNLMMSSASEMSVLSAGGDAGVLDLSFTGDVRMQGSDLKAGANKDGGNIDVTAGSLIWLQDSAVNADAGGTGGNIRFQGARHLVLENTPVSASAVDRDGGNISANTGTFFASESPLSVTSERGAPGTISIQTLATLTDTEVPEDPTLQSADDVIRPDCIDRVPETGSSFVRAGRGGVARLPGGYLPSFRILE